MKKKIILLIDVLKDIKGGAERQVYELLRNIDKEKFQVDLFILHHKDIPDAIKDIGCKAAGLDVKRIYGISGLSAGLKFSGFLRKEKANVLITYHFGSDIWGTIFGRLAGVPVIISNRRDIGFWRRKYHLWAYWLINRWVDTIVTNSFTGKEIIMREEGVKDDKVTVIYNGVDIDRFTGNFIRDKVKERLGFSSDDFIVCCVGNLRSVKGHSYLIEAAPGIIKEFPNTKFMIVGSGPEEGFLANEVKRLGLTDAVVFLGSRDDIPEMISIADICALPSLSEGFSNAILEYMAAGKPVIATKSGGNPEIIEDGINGMLVDPANSAQIEEAIKGLINDSKKRIGIAESAFVKVKNKFKLSLMVTNYENLLKEKTGLNIRVLNLISSNGLFGAERVMLSLAENMNYDGTKSWVTAIRNSHNPHLEVIDEAVKDGSPAEIVDSEGRFDNRAVSQLKSIIKKNRINVINSHNYKANFLGLLASRKAKIPIIATNHLWTSSDFKLRLYELLDAFILNFFIKRIVAVSEDIKRDMVKRGIPASKIEVILNGIRIGATGADNNDLRKSLGISTDATIVAVVARLSPEKGHTFLLKAMSAILKQKTNVTLLIVGDGLLRNSLEQEAAQLGINGAVIFTGYREDIKKIYAAADIVVQPSLREGVPIALLEAMSFGKAIIATNVGGVPGLIKDNHTGILVNSGSAEEIYKALSALLNDSGMRKRLGDNAKELVKNKFSLDTMLEKYKNIYQEVLSPV